MESDLAKYLQLKKRNKARHMALSKYVHPVDRDKVVRTNWHPRQEETVFGSF